MRNLKKDVRMINPDQKLPIIKYSWNTEIV